jgi:hypothetical protein
MEIQPRIYANGREEGNKPQMNQPSRKAMAGKLQIDADSVGFRSLFMEARPVIDFWSAVI